MRHLGGLVIHGSISRAGDLCVRLRLTRHHMLCARLRPSWVVVTRRVRSRRHPGALGRTEQHAVGWHLVLMVPELVTRGAVEALVDAHEEVECIVGIRAVVVGGGPETLRSGGRWQSTDETGLGQLGIRLGLERRKCLRRSLCGGLAPLSTLILWTKTKN